MSLSESIICSNPLCRERVPTDYVLCPYCGTSLVEILQERIKVKIRLRDSLKRIYRLLRDPVRNTELVTKDIALNADRKGPLLLILLFIMSFSMKVTVLLTKVPGFSTPQYEIGGSIQNIIASLLINIVYFVGYYLSVFIIMPFVMALLLLFFGFLFWRIIALIFHGMCKSLAGNGKRGETASILGYSLAPLFFSQIIVALILFVIAPSNPSFTDPNFKSLYSTLDLIIIPFFAWSFYILYLGTKEVHRLSDRASMAVSGSFIGIFVIIFVFGIL